MKKKTNPESVFYFDPEEIEIVGEVWNKDEKFNPRTEKNPGFSADKMTALEKAIAKDGLNHSLLVRNHNDKVKLIAGERRLRAILSLIAKDREALEQDSERVMVYNQRVSKFETAIKVYKEDGVECKVSQVEDEREWVRQAVQENTLHEGLTDYELILQCQKMELAEIPRSEQATIMDMSEAWISQSHSLLNKEIVSPKILEYMEKLLLTRTAAITFLNVPRERQDEVLSRAIKYTYAAAEEKLEQAEQEIQIAEKEIKTGEAGLRLSKFTANTKQAAEARRTINRAKKKIDKASTDIEKINDETAKKISVDVVTKAASDVDAGDDIHKPQSTKQLRQWLGEMEDVLKSEKEIVEVMKKKYDRRDIELIVQFLKLTLDRNHCEHPINCINLVDDFDM